uniref:AAA_12 domain-containing protein n=1 Tax=Steinernema glaseri TaxID=37863 RepID=A0A1I7Y9F0_9BILA
MWLQCRGGTASRVWFNVNGEDERESRTEPPTRCNQREAWAIKEFVEKLLSQNVQISQITIICYYAGQCDLLARLLENQSDPQSFKISTVDTYQGCENDVIIVSMTRTRTLGFLANRRLKLLHEDSNPRCNVSMTRARGVLVIFGRHETYTSVGESEYLGRLARDVAARREVLRAEDISSVEFCRS